MGKVLNEFTEIATNMITFDAAFINENTIWASCNLYNSLYEIDIHSGIGKHKGFFEGSSALITYLHKSVINVDNALFFIPRRGLFIDIYYIDEEKYEHIECEYTHIFNERETAETVIIDQNIYFISMLLDTAIFVFDYGHKKFKKLSWTDDAFAKIRNRFGNVEINHATCCGKHIYAPIRNTSSIMDIDIELDQINIIDLKCDMNIYSLDCDRDKWYMLSERDRYLVIYDRNEEKIAKYSIDDIDLNNERVPFMKMAIWKGKKYLLPTRSINIAHYDEKNNTYQIVTGNLKQPLVIDCLGDMRPWVYGYVLVDDNVYCLPSRTNYIIKINLKTDFVEQIYIKTEEKAAEVHDQIMKRFKYEYMGFVRESMYVDIEDFLFRLKG